VTQLENEVRLLRNIVANKEIEVNQLGRVTEGEGQLRARQAEYQIKALAGLEKALSRQLAELESSVEKLTGKVTPYGMEIKLQERHRESQRAF